VRVQTRPATRVLCAAAAAMKRICGDDSKGAADETRVIRAV